MKVLAIIQARMGSTRLPGKMLKEIAKKPLVFYALDQVKNAKLVDEIVLASTTSKKDEEMLSLVKEKGYMVFAGDENDVLDRYYQTAKMFEGEILVRITGDCPLIDPKIIDELITMFKENDCDYVSNIHPPTFPDGLDVEVFSFASLKKAWNESTIQSEREHVTPYIWKNEDKFRLLNLENEKDMSNLRWTIDDQEDFLLIKHIVESLKGDKINFENVLKVLNLNPNIKEINNKFKRNEGYDKSLREDG